MAVVEEHSVVNPVWLEMTGSGSSSAINVEESSRVKAGDDKTASGGSNGNGGDSSHKMTRQTKQQPWTK